MRRRLEGRWRPTATSGQNFFGAARAGITGIHLGVENEVKFTKSLADLSILVWFIRRVAKRGITMKLSRIFTMTAGAMALAASFRRLA